MSGDDDTRLPLASLQSCRQYIKSARTDTQNAQTRLDGARSTRAAELAEKLADAQAFIDRLAFLVEADIRYREQGGT